MFLFDVVIIIFYFALFLVTTFSLIISAFNRFIIEIELARMHLVAMIVVHWSPLVLEV